MKQVGPGVDESLLDTLVVETTSGNVGGYAQLAIAREADVFRVPDGLRLQSAIATFQAGAVALGLLDVTEVRAGDLVLITAAEGRIGTLLVQLAAARDATVVAAASGKEKLAAATAVGAHIVVDYSEPDWTGQVKEATGSSGCDVVLDAVGGGEGHRRDRDPRRWSRQDRDLRCRVRHLD